MRWHLGAVFATLIVAGSSRAQQPQITWGSTAKTSVFVELLGNGGLLTWNLDRKLNQRTTLRLGYGNYHSIELGDQEPKHYRTYTAMLNGLAGGPTLWMEAGIGGRIGSHRIDAYTLPSKRFRDVTAVIGIRRQPLDGGFVFRAGFTPRYVIESELDYRPGYRPPRLSGGAGASIGVAF